MINIKRTVISRYEENKKNYSGLIQTSIRESEIYEEKRNIQQAAFLSVQILYLQHAV